MQKVLIVVPLFAVACSYPSFVASKVIELDVPVANASNLHCKTHNGSIRVTGDSSSDTIHVRAVLKVRGHTQVEADDNLELLSVAAEMNGDVLKIYGKYPRSELNNRSPSFSYTMQVPERLAVTLNSHNGDIVARGTTGAIRIETHNGNVDATSSNEKTRVDTHNGNIDLVIRSDQDIEGRVTSHNGNIDIEVTDAAHCWLEVKTHNGNIRMPKGIQEATIKRRSVRGRLGDGETDGRLFIRTHNGNIAVHDGQSDSNKKLK